MGKHSRFDWGAEGAITSAAGLAKERGWCYGYICRSIRICDYALRCNNSCYLHYTQKVAPLSWQARRYFL